MAFMRLKSPMSDVSTRLQNRIKYQNRPEVHIREANI